MGIANRPDFGWLVGGIAVKVVTWWVSASEETRLIDICLNPRTVPSRGR
ncbi:MAG TPA: hypothetical protein VE621_18080 [Bryobacteraceae bacterium]|nr:hypothetical protein [Bryobacteraceae bacterium]